MGCFSKGDDGTTRTRCSFLVTLISQHCILLSPTLLVPCLQLTDRHGTPHKHEKSKAARASTRCATWPRTPSSSSGAVHLCPIPRTLSLNAYNPTLSDNPVRPLSPRLGRATCARSSLRRKPRRARRSARRLACPWRTNRWSSWRRLRTRSRTSGERSYRRR